MKRGSMENILNWDQVKKRHGTIAGISVKNGLVKSLLCNFNKNKLYPNIINNDEIIYYVGPNTQSYGIKALFNSWNKGNSFTVFEKLAVNSWKEIGNFKVISQNVEKEDYISFNLKSVL